ncbi:hypothetical protein F5Y13DRAFT_199452 [Hypoxylon sp. FL1857]|nr:hypothetical protein F5Y13DRAFT_199452 [Hypoxylon sp. FL1857]
MNPWDEPRHTLERIVNKCSSLNCRDDSHVVGYAQQKSQFEKIRQVQEIHTEILTNGVLPLLYFFVGVLAHLLIDRAARCYIDNFGTEEHLVFTLTACMVVGVAMAILSRPSR